MFLLDVSGDHDAYLSVQSHAFLTPKWARARGGRGEIKVNMYLIHVYVHLASVKAWRTLLVYTAKNLTSFGSYELIKTQIASIFGKK